MISASVRVGVAVVTAILCLSSSAGAQSAYVGVSALADIARFESSGALEGSSGGQAVGGALRAGAAISDRLGIDVEFVRPGKVKEERSFGQAFGMPTGLLPTPVVSTTAQRFSSLTTMLWIRQVFGSRADVVYLGGMAMVRTTASVYLGHPAVRVDLSGGDGQSVTYGAAPALGLDARVTLTDHLRLVPGLRLLMMDEGNRSGWLTRPSLGLQWGFH